MSDVLRTALVDVVSLIEFHPAIYATIGGLVIGGVAKGLTTIIDRKKVRVDERSVLRAELRQDLDAVREELNILKDEVNEWKGKYWHQVEVNAKLKAAIFELRAELQKSGDFELPHIDLDLDEQK